MRTDLEGTKCTKKSDDIAGKTDLDTRAPIATISGTEKSDPETNGKASEGKSCCDIGVGSVIDTFTSIGVYGSVCQFLG